MKKTLTIVAVLAALIVLASCGADNGKYADLKKILGAEAALIDNLAAAIYKAESATAVAAEIRKFTAGITPALAELMEIERNYPELSQLAENPVEFKNEADRLEKSNAELQRAFIGKSAYREDAEVEAAIDEMTFALGELGM